VRGGVVVALNAATTLHSYEPFDVSSRKSARFAEPRVARAPLGRVTGRSPSTISGTLRAPGSAIIANTAGLSVNRVGAVFEMVTAPGLSLVTHPSLEDLHITAPDGADVGYDAEDGVLTVESDGDIFLDGPFPDLPGVTTIRIIAGGDIIASEDFEFPSNVALELHAERDIDIAGPPPGGPITIPLPRPCGLQATGPPVETEVWSFTMIASTSNEAVEIDVLPWRDPNRLRLGSRQLVPVALLGSESLDVRDVDRSSLRLGPDEAEPIHRFGRPLVFGMDVNRDGHRDLLAVFQLRKLGVAFGDTDLCMSAETREGDAIEGCDAIETLPVRQPKRDWLRRQIGRRADRTR
jgi:filamentous hemagglutinin family protein